MKVSAYRTGFHRDAFESGNSELDFYLKRHLSQDLRRSCAACFVLHEDDSLEVLGYYTLSAFGGRLSALPEAEQKSLPRYPQVPMTLLGRLAVSRELQGQGIGELLLINALKRAWTNREIIGSWAVAVEAIDDSARAFYCRYGFEQLIDEEYRLYLPMKRIGKLFEK